MCSQVYNILFLSYNFVVCTELRQTLSTFCFTFAASVQLQLMFTICLLYCNSHNTFQPILQSSGVHVVHLRELLLYFSNCRRLFFMQVMYCSHSHVHFIVLQVRRSFFGFLCGSLRIVLLERQHTAWGSTIVLHVSTCCTYSQAYTHIALFHAAQWFSFHSHMLNACDEK